MAYSSCSCSRLLLQLQSSSRVMLRLSPFLATPPSSSLSFSSNCHVSSSAQSTLQQAHQRSSEMVASEYADLNLSYNLVTLFVYIFFLRHCYFDTPT